MLAALPVLFVVTTIIWVTATAVTLITIIILCKGRGLGYQQ